MEKLLLKSKQLVSSLKNYPRRYLYNQIDWGQRLIGIRGPRGTGKTTLLLQHLSNSDQETSTYITLDDIFFAENKLVDFAEWYVNRGGTRIYVDEVHKYPAWARELKNIHDFFSGLNIVFTGSSSIEILQAEVDLSRRVLLYELPGLSFREYLNTTQNLSFEPIPIEEIFSNHSHLTPQIIQQIKPLLHFAGYLSKGYYPFVFEDEKNYYHRLENTIKLTLEIDLSTVDGFDPRQVIKLKQLLSVIASSVPFKPNISKLAAKMAIHRTTLSQYLNLLERGRLINQMYAQGKSTSVLQKPEKIYLQNSNLAYLFSDSNPNKGNLRETFLLSQLIPVNSVTIPPKYDFVINDKYLLEVGGKDKSLPHNADIYIAADEIEQGVFNKIPLWLFGFVY